MNTKTWSVDVREADEVIWSRGEQDGTPGSRTARKYRSDGTLMRIKERLEHALKQVNGELSLGLQVTDRIPDIGMVALTNVDRAVPVTCAWNRDADGKILIKASVRVATFASFETVELGVRRNHDITFGVAIDDDNIAVVQVFAGVDEFHNQICGLGFCECEATPNELSSATGERGLAKEEDK